MHPLRNGMKNDYDADEDIPLGDMESNGLRWMSVGVVVAVVAGFFALAWYAYQSSEQIGGDDNIVRAEAGPIKEKPADPGGMKTPYQEMSVYNVLNEKGQGGEEQIEQLLPEPEEPMASREEPAVSATTSRQPEDMQVWLKDQGEVKPAEMAPVKPKLMPAPEEEKAEAVEEKPELADPALMEETEEPAEPNRFMEKAEEAPKPAPVQTETVEVKEVPVAATVAPKPVVVEKPAAQPKPVAAPAASTSEKGSMQVQLAALKTPAEATGLWNQLKTKHADVLGGKQYLIVKAELPQGTFYRLRISGLSANSAKQVCATLSTRKQSCMVIR